MFITTPHYRHSQFDSETKTKTKTLALLNKNYFAVQYSIYHECCTTHSVKEDGIACNESNAAMERTESLVVKRDLREECS